MAYTRQKTWVDGGGQQVDQAWLNEVERQLVEGFGIAPVTNGALVWDGTQFRADALIKNAQIDPAAAIDYSKISVPAGAIAYSKLALGSSIQRSDMAAGNKVTVSAASGGPPGSPSDGDIWIATGVNASGTRWAFQYNSGSASAYKWEFIGGPDLFGFANAVMAIGSGSVWVAGATTCSVTVPRDGDYQINAGLTFNSKGSVENHVFGGIMFNGGNPTNDIFELDAFSSGYTAQIGASGAITINGVSHANPLYLGVYQNVGNVASEVQYRWMRVTPIRVS